MKTHGRCSLKPVKKVIVHLLNSMPLVLVVMGQGLVMYVATAVAKLAFTQLDPLYAVWYRVGFMTLLLLIWRRPWRSERRKLLPANALGWFPIAMVGLSIMLMNTMFYIGISNMDIGIAVAIEFMGPLAVAVVTGNSWRERLGIVIAAVGVVLLAGISLNGPEHRHFLVGLIAIVIGGAMWGVYVVFGRAISVRANAVDTLSVAMLIGWLAQSLVLAVPAVQHLIWPKPGATWAVGWLGIVELLAVLFIVAFGASFIPMVVDQVVMRRSSSAAFSVMQSINPAMAVAVGCAFGEIPGWGDLAGVALVMLAVAVTFSGNRTSV